jgi:hypothetical protein
MPSVSKKQARFMAFVRRKTNGCWIWNGCRGNGRGRFSLEGRTTFAHRASYRLFKGLIPKDLFICHHCDDGLCVNPDHLFLGTQVDNMQDCKRKGRVRNQNNGKTHCPKGHPLSGRNLYLRPDRSSRGCKTCRRARALSYYYGRNNHAEQISQAS